MDGQELPGPVPSLLDAEYWAACKDRRLVFRHCTACGAWHHPPLPLCPKCQSVDLEWRVCNGVGRLYSWTRVHLAMHPSVADVIPYFIGLVEFTGCDGVRLMARLEHAASGPPSIGGECELYWIEAAGGQPIPAFRTLPRAV